MPENLLKLQLLDKWGECYRTINPKHVHSDVVREMNARPKGGRFRFREQYFRCVDVSTEPAERLQRVFRAYQTNAHAAAYRSGIRRCDILAILNSDNWNPRKSILESIVRGVGSSMAEFWGDLETEIPVPADHPLLGWRVPKEESGPNGDGKSPFCMYQKCGKPLTEYKRKMQVKRLLARGWTREEIRCERIDPICDSCLEIHLDKMQRILNGELYIDFRG